MEMDRNVHIKMDPGSRPRRGEEDALGQFMLFKAALTLLGANSTKEESLFQLALGLVTLLL